MYRSTKHLGPFISLNRDNAPARCFEISVVLAAQNLYAHDFMLADCQFEKLRQYALQRLAGRVVEHEFTFASVESIARHFFEWIACTFSWPVVSVRVFDSIERVEGEYLP